MRWKGFITLSALLVAFIAGTILFSSALAQLFIEKTGTALWGAKVETESVDLSFSPLGITVKGFTVASRREEFKNMIEVEFAEFSLLTAPLLERKINIKKISGEGLAFGTERHTSGFISRRKKEEKEDRFASYHRQLSRWLSQVKERAAGKVDIPEIKVEELASFNQARQAQGLLDELKKQADSLKKTSAEGVSTKLEKNIEEVKRIAIKTEKDIVAAEKKIRNLQTSITEAEQFVKETTHSASRFNQKASAAAEEIRKIDEARDKDYRSMMDKLQLPSIGVSDIAETVFGPIIVDRFTTLSGYLAAVRKYIPPKTEKKKAFSTPRFKGENVVFFRKNMYPPFLVKKALISGAGDQYLKFKNFSSAPWLLQSPAEASAAGGNFEIYTAFDRREDVPRDLIRIEHKNFRIDRAEGVLNLKAELEGDEINSEITWIGRGLLPKDWLEYIRLDDPEIEINASVRGSRNSPSFEISSNIDSILSGRLKEELDRQIQQVRKRVQTMIDEKVRVRRDRLMKEVSILRDEITTEVRKKTDRVLQKKKQAEEEIEKKKNEMERFMQEKAIEGEEKIRDLFR